MSDLTIRRLASLDAIDYREVRLHGLQHDPIAFSGCYEQEAHLSVAEFAKCIPVLPSPSAIFGAYLSCGKMVGIVGLKISAIAKLRHKGLLWGMYTLPSVRGTGVGRALMDYLLAYARSETAIERIQLAVVASNVSAKTWYENQGFRLYGVEQNAVKFGDVYEHDELRVLELYETDNHSLAGDLVSSGAD